MKNKKVPDWCNLLFKKYLQEKPSVCIIQPCLETGKRSRKVYEEVKLLRTKKYFEWIIKLHVKLIQPSYDWRIS